eukprot:scaffold64057_cov48-Phaeocystis_antarctica.AAC.1
MAWHPAAHRCSSLCTATGTRRLNGSSPSAAVGMAMAILAPPLISVASCRCGQASGLTMTLPLTAGSWARGGTLSR